MLQVLIEARFVTTTVTDLRELGIEWLIDNRGDSRFEPGRSEIPILGVVGPPESRQSARMS